MTIPTAATADLAAKEAGVQSMQVDGVDKTNDEDSKQKVSV